MNMNDLHRVRFGRSLVAILVGFGVWSVAAAAAQPAAQTEALQRGPYLVQIGGCNDCHTAGYAEQAGAIPEAEWLKGTAVGFQGPRGTSYPSKLRLALEALSEEQWLAFARVPRLPPMPWFNLRDMSDADLRAMYRHVRSLGAAGRVRAAECAARGSRQDARDRVRAASARPGRPGRERTGNERPLGRMTMLIRMFAFVWCAFAPPPSGNQESDPDFPTDPTTGTC